MDKFIMFVGKDCMENTSVEYDDFSVSTGYSSLLFLPAQSLL